MFVVKVGEISAFNSQNTACLIILLSLQPNLFSFFFRKLKIKVQSLKSSKTILLSLEGKDNIQNT